MKISNQMNIQNVLQTYGKSVKKTDATDKVVKASDKVEISSAAREIQIARKALSDVPDVRTDKLEEIKQLMASGNYKPTAEDIVDKIFSGIDAKKI
ncbi:MAG: flagellar biosynthesis anti-sigma factor FlgM [Clostridiales bacterium 38-18]|nr:MAG: flagellar biosynthesis anti-sigma factor FlgM [Clostridiales bacterium 38-18]